MNELKTIFSSPFKGIKMDDIIEASLDKHEQQILDYNRQQLDRGLDAAGKSLGKYKNFKYKNRWEPIDLLKTGDWRSKMTLSRPRGKKQSEIFSQDPKDAQLVKNFGKDIEGLNAQNIDNTGLLIKDHVQTLFYYH